jgi:predicted PurR-regulated permease PerM
LRWRWSCTSPPSLGLPPDWIKQLSLVGGRLARGWGQVARAGGDLRVVLEPYTDWIRQSVVDVGRTFADSVLQFILSLIVAAMFWANGDAVGAVLRDVARQLGGETATQALVAAGRSLRGVAYGGIGTTIIQGIFMSVGSAVAGVPALGLLGFVVMLLAISQIGAPLIVLIWGGAAWWLFRQGAGGWGVFMLIWGLVLVSMSDKVIRPWLISQGVTMPLTLVILGLFIGPALLAVAFTLLKAWRTQPLVPPGV